MSLTLCGTDDLLCPQRSRRSEAKEERWRWSGWLAAGELFQVLQVGYMICT